MKEVRVRDVPGAFGNEMPWIHPGFLRDWGSGGILPAFVVGHETDRDLQRAVVDRHEPPSAKVNLQFDYNGVAMVGFALWGFVLPLRWNRSRSLAPDECGRHDVDDLLDAMRIHAQSAQTGKPVRDARSRALRALIPHRCGHVHSDMTDRDLEAFAATLRRSFRVPQPTRGFEALVEFGEVDPQWPCDWTALTFSTDHAGWARPTGSTSLTMTEVLEFGSPRLWLVWENCD